jgi:hypothetical protein
VNGKPWTDKEHNTLRNLTEGCTRIPWKKVLKHLPGRTRGGVYAKRRELGISVGGAWSEREVLTLKREWGQVSQRILRNKLKPRTWDAIKSKAREIGLPVSTQGLISVNEACRVSGLCRPTLTAILEELGVNIRNNPTPTHLQAIRYVHKYVELDHVLDAAKVWMRRETTEQASKRTGISSKRLSAFLVNLSFKQKGSRARVRLDPERWDEIVAEIKAEKEAIGQ